MTKKKEQSLIVHAMQVRDDLIRRIHAKRIISVTKEDSGQQLLRAQGYNDGLTDAVNIVMELI